MLPVMILLGCGAGIAFPALMNIALSGATNADAGLASGLVDTSAQIGGALGRALLATRSDRLIGDGKSEAAALTSGYHLAFLVGAGLAVLAILVTLAVLRPREQAAHANDAPGGEPAWEPVGAEELVSADA